MPAGRLLSSITVMMALFILCQLAPSAIPVIVLSRSPGFQLSTIWHLGVASVWSQLALGLVLLRREYGKRLAFAVPGKNGLGLSASAAVLTE